MRITEWLGGDGVGMSSKAIALAALGDMPKDPPWPHDGDDFGRCVRLLMLCPDAKAGLEHLGRYGGPCWRALVPRWAEIEEAWKHDKDLYASEYRDNRSKYKCYDLIRSILKPAEEEFYSESGKPRPIVITGRARK